MTPSTGPSPPRDPQAGFTLIEALVAMAVLALGSVSLLTATEGHTVRIGALTDRIAARWTADARLAEVRLGLEAPETVEMLGRDWSVRTDFADTSDPDLVRATVTVAPAATPDSPLVTLTGYVDAVMADPAAASDGTLTGTGTGTLTGTGTGTLTGTGTPTGTAPSVVTP